MLYLKNVFVQKTSDCIQNYARFVVIVEVSMKIAVFVHVTPCRLVQICQFFGGICCCHLKGRRCYSATFKREAICFSKSVDLYKTTQCHILEDGSV